MTHSKRDALIVHSYDFKPTGDFDHAIAIARFREGQNDPPFADLIQHVERQRDEANEVARAEIHCFNQAV